MTMHVFPLRFVFLTGELLRCKLNTLREKLPYFYSLRGGKLGLTEGVNKSSCLVECLESRAIVASQRMKTVVKHPSDESRHLLLHSRDTFLIVTWDNHLDLFGIDVLAYGLSGDRAVRLAR